MKKLIIVIRHFIMEVLRFLLWHSSVLFPIDSKKIIVSCFKGKGFTDNPKYIVEELISRRSDLNIVWLVKNNEEAESLPDKVRFCIYNRLSAIYHYITSLIWIDNVRKDEKFIKKREQFYLQTWHGGGAIKRVENDAIEQLSKGYVEKAKKDASATDLMIAEGLYYAEIYRSSFWYNGEIAVTGLPRYDIVYKESTNEVIRNKIHQYFNLNDDVKILLYAPTFRKGYGFEYYNIDYKQVLKVCENKFGGKFVAYVHLHPNVANKFSELKYDNISVFNATFYPDMQELITASDILITDFSSAIVDFSITGKPGFRFAIDADQYNKDRGCYFDYENDYPYPLAKNNEQLINSIEYFDEKKYKEDLYFYFKKLGLQNIGCSSSLICDMVEFYIENKSKSALFDKFKSLLYNG